MNTEETEAFNKDNGGDHEDSVRRFEEAGAVLLFVKISILVIGACAAV